jgi:hypothetical protein
LDKKKYSTVTQPPPETQNLGALLNAFMAFAGITKETYSVITEELTEDVYRHTTISSDSLKKYNNEIFPSSYARNTIKLMFKEICDESVQQQWMDSFSEIEKQKVANDTIKKSANKKTDSKSAKEPQELDTTEKEKPKVEPYKKIVTPKTALFIFILLSVLYLLYSIVNKNEKRLSDTPSISTLKKIINNPPDTSVKKPITDSKAAIVLSEGLLLDVYSLGDKYKNLPDKPEGLKIARLPLNKGGEFSFVDHIVNENIANSTADRDVGLHYQGYIDLKGNGEFIFQLNYQSGEHFIQQFPKKCQLTLKVNNESIFDKKVYVGQGQSYSMQSTADFSAGLNPFSLWFACPNLRSFSPKQDYNAFKDTSVTLYIKQPNDKEITKIMANKFSYDPDK